MLRVFIERISGNAGLTLWEIFNLYILFPGRLNLNFKFSSMQEFFFVRIEKTYIKLRFTDILYMQAEKKYVNIFAVDKSYTALCPIGHVEKILPVEIFCKVHRSYIVSLEHASKFDNDFIYIGNKKIPISEQYRSILKNS